MNGRCTDSNISTCCVCLAKLHYESAIKVILPHKDLRVPAVSEAERVEIRSLLVSLHSNHAMVHMKQEDWAAAVKCTNHALGLEPDNVKSLFRRGSCHGKTGNLEAGRADLQRVVELDPSNVAAKKELIEITKQLKLLKEKEKAAFAGVFSGPSMYADREQERAVKAKKLEEERRIEQDQWTQSKLSRRESGLPEQSIDEWKKERDDKRKAASPPSAKTAKTSAPKKPKVEPKSDDEYDEEDEKLIKETTSKGYCYFRNQLDTETKELIGDIRPKSLSATEAPVSEAVPSAAVSASDWNHAGTWEERDFTQLVKSRMEELCKESTYEQPFSDNDDDTMVKCSVKEVKKCEGEAQVVLTRGKKRHMYDFQLDIKFEVSCQKVKYPGHILFHDVSPGCDLECSIEYKKLVPAEVENKVKSCVTGLRDTIIRKIRSFEVEYRSM